MPTRSSSSTRWPPVTRAWSVMVVGCGLIGGSVASAARRRWPSARILGVDRSSVTRRALELGVIDEGHSPRSLAPLLADRAPDVVVLALPTDPLLRCLPILADAPGPPDRLVMDVSSVKAPIVAAARGCRGFVGGHPMAGRERGGVEQASPDLFVDRTFALCAAPDTTAADVRRARTFVTGLGASPLVLDAAVHDRCVALTSHLPHVLAIALMQQAANLRDELGARGARGLPWSLGAGAWRDATRVARADPTMWNGIAAHNREALTEAIDGLTSLLESIREALTQGEDRPLEPDASDVDARGAARLRAQIDPFLPKTAPPPLHEAENVGHDRQRLGRRRHKPRR